MIFILEFKGLKYIIICDYMAGKNPWGVKKTQRKYARKKSKLKKKKR
jgi:hypothetical protein